MPISGYVAGGASEALEEVLDRRLKEQIRQQQEKQHADQIAVQRQQIDLQQRRDEAMDLERQKDREWRTQQGDIATAQRAEADTDPGAITPEIAAVLSKDPAIAGRISQRKVIDASPIAAQSVLPGTVMPDRPMPRQIDNLLPRGTAPTAMGGAVTAGVDASGPQQYPVLGATPKQAQAAKARSDTQTFNEELSRAPSEDVRRQVAARAAAQGIKLDPNLVGATEAEQRATTLQAQIAAEQRANQTWKEHNAITNAQTGDRTKPEWVQMGDGSIVDLNKVAPPGSKPITATISAKQAADMATNERAVTAMKAYGDDMLSVIDSLLDEKGKLKPGAASVVGGIGGALPEWAYSSEEGQAALADIDRLQSMLNINTLRELKSQSRTGASGFGALSEKELGVIESSASKLRRRRQSEDVYADELKRIRTALQTNRGGGGAATKETPAEKIKRLSGG